MNRSRVESLHERVSALVSHRIRMARAFQFEIDRCVVHAYRTTDRLVLFVCYSAFVERPRPPIFVDNVPFPFILGSHRVPHAILVRAITKLNVYSSNRGGARNDKRVVLR
jgi:hypothetical protein